MQILTWVDIFQTFNSLNVYFQSDEDIKGNCNSHPHHHHYYFYLIMPISKSKMRYLVFCSPRGIPI